MCRIRDIDLADLEHSRNLRYLAHVSPNLADSRFGSILLPGDTLRRNGPVPERLRRPAPGHEAGGGTLTDQLIERPQAARSTLGGSPFPPIADYGFLSDCEVSALVAPSGKVEWLCLPRMDGPSVFAAILDRGAGSFRLGPADVMVPSGRRYLPGTMVLETTWSTPTGWAVVRDVLLVGPWRHGSSRSETHRRVPADQSAERHVELDDLPGDGRADRVARRQLAGLLELLDGLG